VNIINKTNQLIFLLDKFLKGKATSDDLNAFVWEVIDYFSDTPKNELPPELSEERIFWYAVWEIQHLNDDDHMSSESCRSQMKDILSYLQRDKELPSNFSGKRP
jgi:hypothetical protein